MTFASYWEMFHQLSDDKQNRFVDYCVSDALDFRWSTQGTGSIAPFDDIEVGYRTSCTAGQSIQIDTNQLCRSFDYQDSGFICLHQRVTDANHTTKLGLTGQADAAGDYALAVGDPAQTYFRFSTHNTADNTTDSTNTRDTSQHVHSFELSITNATYKIDGLQEVLTTTQLPNQHMEPYLYATSSSGTNTSNINYIEVYGT